MLKAPFPYFGGKSAVVDVVWSRLGNVPNYCESFFGSGAMLLGRPHEPGTETVNDIDTMICNFYRSVRDNPGETAAHADCPANETDLYARHKWLVSQKEGLKEKLEEDPEYYDTKIAGWWVWGISLWIGGGFCSGKDTHRRQPHLAHAGKGVHRKRLHLHNHGQGIIAKDTNANLYTLFDQLSERLKRVRVCCGDWKRICGPSPTYYNGLTGVFLDPPYGAKANRDNALYAHESLTIADDVRTWCIANGGNKLMRIALCGYVGEHEELQDYGWSPHYWKARGGYGNQSEGRGRDNARREVIWFSPHCLDETQMTMF